MIAFFPIVANTLFGLLSADQGQHDLFTLHDASRWTRLWKLQLPGGHARDLRGLPHLGRPVGDRRHRRRLLLPPGRPGHRHADRHLPIAPRVREALRRAHPLVAARPRRVLVLRLARQPRRRARGTTTTRNAQSLDLTTTQQHLQGGAHAQDHARQPGSPFRSPASCSSPRAGDDSDSSSAHDHGAGRGDAPRRRARPPPAAAQRRPAASGRRRDIARGRLPRHRDRARPTGTPRPSTAACTRWSARPRGRHRTARP